ncbi:MAG: glucose-6-phosphate dehydrogenase assembly protein OpcA [Chthoniobacterales bacterium]
MSTQLSDFINPGLPVELGAIEKSLGQLWEQTDDTKTRASLINLVIYTEDFQSAEANTQLIAQLAGEHACRAILVVANPSAKETSAKSWISAHCQKSGKNQRQICSEQITFQLDGNIDEALPNIVFSHLDSDLPLYFWWQGNFRKSLNTKFWSWVDRLLFDSRDWENFSEQIDLARSFAKPADSLVPNRHTILCDLNWARLLQTRFAIAKFFDNGFALSQLNKLKNFRIEYGTGCRSTAIFLLGWFAKQLGWQLTDLLQKPYFITKNKKDLSFELAEVEGRGIQKLSFLSEEATFTFVYDEKSHSFHVHVEGKTCPSIEQILPVGRNNTLDILLHELNRGGNHPLYTETLETIEPLF